MIALMLAAAMCISRSSSRSCSISSSGSCSGSTRSSRNFNSAIICSNRFDNDRSERESKLIIEAWNWRVGEVWIKSRKHAVAFSVVVVVAALVVISSIVFAACVTPVAIHWKKWQRNIKRSDLCLLIFSWCGCSFNICWSLSIKIAAVIFYKKKNKCDGQILNAILVY